MKNNVIDLFAGCGGLTDGFLQTGKFRTLAAVDWELPTVKTLQKRLATKYGYDLSKKNIIHFDIQRTDELLNGFSDSKYGRSVGLKKLINNKAVDLIIGGPPCQAYSIAGRIRDENGMHDDYRNYLFESYIKVVNHFKPKAFVFENVEGILSAKPGGIPIVKRISEGFSEIGYEIATDLRNNAVFDTSFYGVPQRRKRVIIFGVPKNSTSKSLILQFYNKMRLKKQTKPTIAKIAFENIPKIYPVNLSGKISHKVELNSCCEILKNHEPRFHNQRDIEIFKTLANDIKTGRNKYLTSKALIQLYKEKTGKTTNVHKYHVIRMDKPSNTIPAHLYKDGLRHIHPDPEQARSITVREAARIQSFDDDFEFLGSKGAQYKMIGNAVPPKFAKIIGEVVDEVLKEGIKTMIQKNKYYLKKLQFQELGSPKPDGKVSRGRYMLISKDTEGFFPPLSKTQRNDAILIPFILDDSDKKIYCTYVYHNDKYHGSTARHPRDEYRLYLNQEIDNNRSFFQPGDIIIFEKIETEELVNMFRMHRIAADNENYTELDKIIDKSEQRGGHAVFEGNFDFITPYDRNLDALETVIPSEVKKEAEDRQNEVRKARDKDIEETKGANLFNATSFRDFVLLGYENKCAVTGESIYYKKLSNLEAAHIKPKSHSGSFLPCNGIAMSRDIHWAFDKGMFKINDDYTITVHEDVKETLLGKFDNKMITIPVEDFFKPEKSYLKYHSDKIYGLFKHAGVMRKPD